MARSFSSLRADRPPLRGICLFVKNGQSGREERHASARKDHRPSFATNGVVEFPRRPDSAVLSEKIPFFFIGRNNRGLWVVREAEGRTGGVFFFKTSALRFAQKASMPIGYATMVLGERFELDVENRGNPIAAWLDALMRKTAGLIPAYPPPISLGQKIFKGERR
jgi:hypothetical protein